MGQPLPPHRPALVPIGARRAHGHAAGAGRGAGASLAGVAAAGLGATGGAGASGHGRALPVGCGGRRAAGAGDGSCARGGVCAGMGRRMTPHTLDTVEFSVGDEGRVGLLHLPEGSGWYPAVVVIGEAADGPEAPLTDFLVDSGYAVLTFDEPGVGLAAAALAAADSLLM